MSIEQIKAEVAAMSVEQQNHLVAYVIHLRHERDPKLKEELARKMDDREPANWKTLDQLKEHWKG
jgi:hypothetical protein